MVLADETLRAREAVRDQYLGRVVAWGSTGLMAKREGGYDGVVSFLPKQDLRELFCSEIEKHLN